MKVDPKVFRWVMESGGWKPEEVAEKTKIPVETISKMQLEEYAVDAALLKRIAKKIGRPLAVFFLPEPPAEPMLPDFRRIAGTEDDAPSKKMLATIRKARHLQYVARDLLAAQGASQKPNIKSYALEDEPEEVAGVERNFLGLGAGTDPLSTGSSSREFYNELRDRVESLNIFVCQAPTSLDETRGFTLSDGLPCVMVISTSDKYEPRIFTLLHEYAHILLKKNGICLPDRAQLDDTDDNPQRIEAWCNAFAGHILMPREAFAKCVEAYKEFPPETVLKKLSRRFHVSKQAAGIQFGKLDMHKIYGEQMSTREMYFTDSTTLPKKRGHPDPVNMCISRKGRKFVTLVLDSKEKQLISYSDVVEYLDLGLPHMEKMQEKV